ncbi:transcriptional regulator, LysR family, partial [gut metagenome]
FSALRRQYPGITLRITTASTDQMLQLLDQNEVDLAFTLDRHVYHRDYIIAGEECIGTHFITAANDPLTTRGPLSMAEIVTLPCILTEHGMSYRNLLEHYLAQHSLEIDPILEIGNTDLICRLVEQSMGIAFLPDYVTEQAVASGKLARLEVTGLDIKIWKQLLYHRNKCLTPPLKTVMSIFYLV